MHPRPPTTRKHSNKQTTTGNYNITFTMDRGKGEADEANPQRSRAHNDADSQIKCHNIIEEVRYHFQRGQRSHRGPYGPMFQGADRREDPRRPCSRENLEDPFDGTKLIIYTNSFRDGARECARAAEKCALVRSRPSRSRQHSPEPIERSQNDTKFKCKDYKFDFQGNRKSASGKKGRQHVRKAGRAFEAKASKTQRGSTTRRQH